jgi:3-methyladenine DNA glycosylase AlkD
MEKNKIYREIRTWCEKNADRKIVQKYSRYFKEGYDAHGLDSKKLDAEFGIWGEKYFDKMNFADAKKLGEILYSSGKYEESAIAVRIFKRYESEYKKSDLNILKKWLDKYATTWAHTDVMCWEVIKLFYYREIIKYSDLKSWLTSKSTWTRRAVPVSFIKIIDREKIPLLLEFVRPLIEDKERPIHQGIGWFYREAWKKEPKSVEKILIEIKDFAPRTIIQYATEKMDKKEKIKYKAVKTV